MASRSASTEVNQYLTFRIGPESYAIDVAHAREIVEFTHVTQIPNMPKWIRGVVNLRGAVVPIVDLKQRFSMGETERTRHACIVIVEFPFGAESFVLGILADGVQEVFEFPANEIEPAPKFGASVATEYLRGLGRRGDKLFIILDAVRLFTGTEVSEALGVAESGPPPAPEPAAAAA